MPGQTLAYAYACIHNVALTHATLGKEMEDQGEGAQPNRTEPNRSSRAAPPIQAVHLRPASPVAGSLTCVRLLLATADPPRRAVLSIRGTSKVCVCLR